MIRIGLPPPMLSRLRLHWHATQTHYLSQSRALREYATRTTAVWQTRWESVCAWGVARLSLRAHALARRRAQLACFEEKYEDLVDLLCWAAKDGVHTDRDARYAELRSWMRVHYRKIRPNLRPYCVEIRLPAAPDPFEALFSSENMDSILHASDGIEYILQTRSILEEYRGALDARLPRH